MAPPPDYGPMLKTYCSERIRPSAPQGFTLPPPAARIAPGEMRVKVISCRSLNTVLSRGIDSHQGVRVQGFYKWT
jgi:hypothetical protein